MIVASIVASLLLGIAGGTATTSVVLYTDAPATIAVQGIEYELLAGETRSVPVEFPVEPGHHSYTVLVVSDTVSYELPVTVEGKRSWFWLWLLAPAPVLICGGWFLIRRRGAGSS